MQLSAMGQLSGEGANVVHSLHAELVTPPIPPTLSLGQRTVPFLSTGQRTVPTLSLGQRTVPSLR